LLAIPGKIEFYQEIAILFVPQSKKEEMQLSF